MTHGSLWTAALCVAALTAPHPAAAAPPEPPGPATTGYGSEAAYLSPAYTLTETGAARTGRRVWTYVPDILRDGATAPVVVFLHGWTAYLPEYYLGHIAHLLAQGIIVIYPQYQRSGPVGLLTDSDQTQYLDRAVSAVRGALRDLGPMADAQDITVTGHSLGGLLTLCWNSASPDRAQRLLMVHAAFTDEGVPDEVPIIPLDWAACAASVDVPAFFLTGDADPLAPESLLAYGALESGPHARVYLAQTDDHGRPALTPAHGAPVCPGAPDTLDSRLYFAALDGVIAGETELPFDLGAWSDGVPVLPPFLWAP